MHKPVLAAEVMELLAPKEGGVYVDGTLGSGGHAELILGRIGAGGKLLGIDRDGDAVARCKARLAQWGEQCILRQGNFADVEGIAGSCGIARVDGLVLDLGMSSDQLDDGSRGFSLLAEGPLDMRMDRSSGPAAADLVNGLSEEELRNILWEFGEERAARRIARAIVRARERCPLKTTADLVQAVLSATGGARGRIHPATRTFQAIRIAVNRELEALAAGLEAGLRLIAPGGRMAVISFHSLEDRIVKRCFAAHAGAWRSLEDGGRRLERIEPGILPVTKRPVRPGEKEVRENPRARSAKLRVAERLANGK